MAFVAPLVLRLDGLSAAVEATYGTDAAPVVTTNAIRPGKRIWPQLKIEYRKKNLRDDAASGALVPLPPTVAAQRVGTLRFDWELRGLGSAYTGTLPAGGIEADPFFQACGWVGAFSATPTPQYTYTPVSTAARPSITIYAYAAGRLVKLVGCRGRMRILFRAGEIAYCTFEMQGAIPVDWADAALPNNFAYNTQFPPPAVSQAITVGAWTPDDQELELDGGNTLEWLESGTGPWTGTKAAGLHSYDYGFMAPQVRIRGLTVPTATYDPLLDQGVFSAIPQAPQGRALAASINSTIQYNRASISDTNIYAIETTFEDRQRFAGWQPVYRMSAPSILFN